MDAVILEPGLSPRMEPVLSGVEVFRGQLTRLLSQIQHLLQSLIPQSPLCGRPHTSYLFADTTPIAFP